MKKTITSIGLLLLAVAAQSQVIVTEDGNMFVQMIEDPDAAILNVGDGPARGYSYYNYTGKVGAHVHSQHTQYGDNFGIVSEACKSSSTGNSIGIYGIGKGSSSGHRDYGVVGTIEIGATGAGITGTTEGDIPPSSSCNGNYAGYFDGETYVSGPLTVTGNFYNLSDIRLKEDVMPFYKTEGEKGTALENLQQLEILEYTLKNVRQVQAEEAGEDYKENLSDLARKELSRRHFGLSAQKLQEVYPELVRESQEGFLTVNYTELVPILIRSIQELKVELDELKGAASRSLTRSEQADERHINPSIVNRNILYQNTPNPFREQTSIRFRLADDVRDAKICIFDLSGKLIKKLPLTQGMESVSIGGWELGEGIFLYSLLVAGQEIDTKRMVITK